MLLTGTPVTAKDAVGWLIDYAGPMQESLQTVWRLASCGEAAMTMRRLDEGPLQGVSPDAGVPVSDSPATQAARKAIMRIHPGLLQRSVVEALQVQAGYSAEFTVTSFCREGSIGAEHGKTMML